MIIMGSGKRNYRALRFSTRKWRKKDSSLEIKKEKQLTKEQNEEKKQAMEKLISLYKKAKQKTKENENNT